MDDEHPGYSLSADKAGAVDAEGPIPRPSAPGFARGSGSEEAVEICRPTLISKTTHHQDITPVDSKQFQTGAKPAEVALPHESKGSLHSFLVLPAKRIRLTFESYQLAKHRIGCDTGIVGSNPSL